MKLMIASDLHGSAHYIRLLTDRLLEEKPDRLLLLGDLLYHGPRNDLPRDYDTKCSAMLLNSILPPPLSIRGNCDGEVDQMILQFPILSEFAAVFADGKTFYLTHGHHLEAAASAASPGDIILFGHTHVPAFYESNARIFVNPGSVSIPKEGSAHSFLLWESGVFLWKNVETGAIWQEAKV